MTGISVSYANEEKSLLKKADKHFNAEEYEMALKKYQTLYDNDNKDGHVSYHLGVCILKFRADKASSLSYLQRAQAMMPHKNLPDEFYFYLGEAYHLNYQFDAAIKAFTKFLGEKGHKIDDDIILSKIKASKFAKELVNNPVDVTIENLGPNVNSPYPDYDPLITTDESLIVFTSERPGNKGGLLNEKYKADKTKGHYNEDIFISHKTPDSSWSKPESIGDNINTIGHDASVGLSPDGQELFIYRKNLEDPGSIYSSRHDGDLWTTPVPAGRNINSKYVEERASITADGTEIYFSSNRPEGRGGMDIYKVKLIANDIWSKPINLGKVINSSSNESAPFIHPSGKILYFSSTAHNSMGGYDIFMSKFEDGEWTTPVNLGHPINTVNDDMNFVLSADGQNGYYASIRPNGYGDQDIYKVKMPLSNVRITMVKGVILGGDNLKPVPAKISVVDRLIGEKVKYIYNPNPKTGKYLMIFPPGRNYDMIIDAEGYKPSMVNIYVPNQSYFFELYQEIILQPINGFGEKLGQEITVKNVFYDIRKPQDEITSDIIGLHKDKMDETQSDKNYEALLNIIKELIMTTDSVLLRDSLDKRIKEIPPFGVEDDQLLELVLDVINRSDSIGIKEKTVPAVSVGKSYFYNSTEMEKVVIDGDTMLVLPSFSAQDTSLIKRKEKKDGTKEINYKIPKNERKQVVKVNLTFDVNSFKIKEEEYSIIDNIAQLASKKATLGIELYGYTDAQGDELFNQQLAKSRVQEIAKYLVEKKGMGSNRLLIEAVGELNPIANNKTEEGRRLNRRVELILVDVETQEK